jgi:hypothetical protein
VTVPELPLVATFASAFGLAFGLGAGAAAALVKKYTPEVRPLLAELRSFVATMKAIEMRLARIESLLPPTPTEAP